MATESKKTLLYKGRPLMRKDNIIYYGSMADPYIVMMQVLETKTVDGQEIASKVSVQLQLTDPSVKSRDRVTKRSEKDGIYSALDVGSVWLERALNANSKSFCSLTEQQTEVTYHECQALSICKDAVVCIGSISCIRFRRHGNRYRFHP